MWEEVFILKKKKVWNRLGVLLLGLADDALISLPSEEGSGRQNARKGREAERNLERDPAVVVSVLAVVLELENQCCIWKQRTSWQYRTK